MNGDDLSLLRPATPDDHAAHSVARSDESTEPDRPAQRRAVAPARAPRATGGERLARLVSSCDYGTKDCRAPATVAVSIDGLPARPMCRRHALLLVDAVALYADPMTLQVRVLDTEALNADPMTLQVRVLDLDDLDDPDDR